MNADDPIRKTAPDKPVGKLIPGQNLKSVSWAVWLIFGLCLLPEVYFVGAEHGVWGNPKARQTALYGLAFWAGLLGNWQPNYAGQPYLMFLTYGFLHGGLTHFAVNMVTLFSLGAPVAAVMRGGWFLAAYGVLLVAGAAGFAAFPEAAAPMVGASGALFGLAGIVLAWNMQDRRSRGQSQLPVLRSVALLVGLNVVLWWAMHGQLAWQTHLGGFVGGWVLAVLCPVSRFTDPS